MRRFLPLLLTLAAEVTAVVALPSLWSPPADLVGRILWIAAVAGAWWLLASTVLTVVAQVSRRAGSWRTGLVRMSTRLTLPALRRFTERTLAASLLAGGLLVAPTAASAQTEPTPAASSTVDGAADPGSPAEAVPVPDPVPPETHEGPADGRADGPDDGPAKGAHVVAVRTGRVGDPSARTVVNSEPFEPHSDEPPASGSDPRSDEMPPASSKHHTSDGNTSSGGTSGGNTSDGNTSGGGTPPGRNPDRGSVSAPSVPGPSMSAAVPAPTASTGSVPTPTHTVAAGDNLWDIAAGHLAATTGRDAATIDEAEIAAYWRRVCDTNRSRLHSGDVNLIFAGEVVELPPI